MKKLKLLNAINEDGRIHGNLDRTKIKLVENQSLLMHNHL